MSMSGVRWPTVRVEMFGPDRGVTWVPLDGKPRCASHQGTCLVRASVLGLRGYDDDEFVCHLCMAEHLHASDEPGGAN